MFRRLSAIVKNKYLIAALAFGVWICFFDTNDLVNQFRMRMKLKDMQTEKTYLEKEISLTETEKEELLSSPGKLEKFAREKYMMKKDNEDLYIIVNKGSKDNNPVKN